MVDVVIITNIAHIVNYYLNNINKSAGKMHCAAIFVTHLLAPIALMVVSPTPVAEK